MERWTRTVWNIYLNKLLSLPNSKRRYDRLGNRMQLPFCLLPGNCHFYLIAAFHNRRQFQSSSLSQLPSTSKAERGKGQQSFWVYFSGPGALLLISEPQEVNKSKVNFIAYLKCQCFIWQSSSSVHFFFYVKLFFYPHYLFVWIIPFECYIPNMNAFTISWFWSVGLRNIAYCEVCLPEPYAMLWSYPYLQILVLKTVANSTERWPLTTKNIVKLWKKGKKSNFYGSNQIQ